MGEIQDIFIDPCLPMWICGNPWIRQIQGKYKEVTEEIQGKYMGNIGERQSFCVNPCGSVYICYALSQSIDMLNPLMQY